MNRWQLFKRNIRIRWDERTDKRNLVGETVIAQVGQWAMSPKRSA